ncbi:hypothetical protein Tco_1452106 [Tanacetum coccineum]
MNVNLEGRDTAMTDAPLPNVQATQETKDTHVILTAPINPEGQQQSSSVSSGFVSNMLNPRPNTGIDSILNLNTEVTSLLDVLVTTIAEPPRVSATTIPPPTTPLITQMPQTPVPTPTTVSSTSLQNLLNFGSLFGFDHRLKTLEIDFFEFKQTNQFAEAVSSIPSIVDNYLANKMNEAIKTAVQLQSDRLREKAQAENEDFLNKLDDNIKKIIKDQVKEQVKAQVSKILPKIEKLVNDQLKSEVLIRSSNEAKTSHAVAANLSELEVKKILIDKMEANKSIDKSDIQKNLYKVLVDTYDADKDILDAYGDTVTIKRRRDDADDDEEPSAGSNRGSKRRRSGKEPESTSAPKEKTSKTAGKLTKGSKSHHRSAGESAQVEEPMHTARDLEEHLPTPDRDWNKTLRAVHGPVQPCRTYATSVTKTKAADYGHIKWIEDLVPNTIWSEVLVNYDKHALWGISHWGRKHQQFYGFAANRELARDVYSKRRIIVVIKLQIVEWYDYKHLDWITVRKDDNKLYTFKEGDFKRLRLQDIEDMMILLIQGKLTNLNVEDRLTFGVSLRMFTRSIFIQRRVEDL